MKQLIDLYYDAVKHPQDFYNFNEIEDEMVRRGHLGRA
jgi:hypothetical protein